MSVLSVLSHWSYSAVFRPAPYCFHYSRFVMELEIRKCDASDLVLFSQNGFGYPRVVGGSI